MAVFSFAFLFIIVVLFLPDSFLNTVLLSFYSYIHAKVTHSVFFFNKLAVLTGFCVLCFKKTRM